MNTFSDSYIKKLHSFVRTSFDLQEIALFLPIYSRRYQYKPSVKFSAGNQKRKISLRKLFVRVTNLEYIYAEFRSADLGQTRTNKSRNFFFCTNFIWQNFFPLRHRMNYCIWVSNFQDMLNYNLTTIAFWWNDDEQCFRSFNLLSEILICFF